MRHFAAAFLSAFELRFQFVEFALKFFSLLLLAIELFAEL